MISFALPHGMCHATRKPKIVWFYLFLFVYACLVKMNDIPGERRTRESNRNSMRFDTVWNSAKWNFFSLYFACASVTNHQRVDWEWGKKECTIRIIYRFRTFSIFEWRVKFHFELGKKLSVIIHPYVCSAETIGNGTRKRAHEIKSAGLVDATFKFPKYFFPFHFAFVDWKLWKKRRQLFTVLLSPKSSFTV